MMQHAESLQSAVATRVARVLAGTLLHLAGVN